ncbi:MAG TPA: hypothetical protein VFS25_12450 [Chitinophaga sp.]|uniref:hypothetical protein n=1 Tax=Chitinophaga sp. TaxID=1869181 RepID=UPI002DBC9DCE|nr:hypothetical protein [Chitinophaga sp.]HEU4553643.1 hypothetical protein [Chitinophaga sp.]
MLNLIHYIILIGHEPRLLPLLRNKLLNLAGEAQIDIADINDLNGLLCKQRPDLLLYATAADELYLPYIDIIRKNPVADEIPIVVCQGEIEEAVLIEILRGINGNKPLQH